MNYTREQIIQALLAEDEFERHDMDIDETREEFIERLLKMSMDELIYETATGDYYPLEEFMSNWCHLLDDLI